MTGRNSRVIIRFGNYVVTDQQDSVNIKLFEDIVNDLLIKPLVDSLTEGLSGLYCKSDQIETEHCNRCCSTAPCFDSNMELKKHLYSRLGLEEDEDI
jgi:hypothetical protein